MSTVRLKKKKYVYWWRIKEIKPKIKIANGGKRVKTDFCGIEFK